MATLHNPPPQLEPALLETLVALERQRLGPSTPSALAREVRRVSALYNDGVAPPAGDAEALRARLRFFLPRDLSKLHRPLTELHRLGALPARSPLRVLDLGAGLGTGLLALARFAARHGIASAIDADAVDRDGDALTLAGALLARARELQAVPVTLRAIPATLDELGAPPLRPPYDVVLLGLVLSELALDERDEQAAALAHHDRLLRVLPWLAEDAAVIVLEPALRRSARALQRLRGVLCAPGSPLHVFAPCLHCEACPLLLRERDWCHAAEPMLLPEPLAAVARAAGLRDRDLTYSYLTLLRQPRRLAALSERPLLRVVGGPLRSKGKLEVHVCGAGPTRVLRRLDRHRSPANQALQHAQRGDLLALQEQGSDAVVRVSAEQRVERLQ